MLVSGEVVTPTPQELAAFPDKFELIVQNEPEPEAVKSGELSPEVIGKRSIREILKAVDSGKVAPADVLEAEERRKKPRKSLVQRLKDRI